MLEATDLTVWRGHTRLFEGLTFRVEPGRALVLRGPNGAGKTTLLRVLCGLTRPDRGQVAWDDRVRQEALRGLVAYSGHQPALNADLTVRQNLRFYAELEDARPDWDGLLRPLGLEACDTLEVRHLSAGQKRRTGLARLLLSAAPAWLLDEPMTNLDAAGRRYVGEQIIRHLREGGLAVIAAHDALDLPDAVTGTLVLGEG
jgi:heme exporter protein A